MRNVSVADLPPSTGDHSQQQLRTRIETKDSPVNGTSTCVEAAMSDRLWRTRRISWLLKPRSTYIKLLQTSAVRAVLQRGRSPSLSPACGWRITAALKASECRSRAVRRVTLESCRGRRAPARVRPSWSAGRERATDFSRDRRSRGRSGRACCGRLLWHWATVPIRPAPTP